MDRSSEQRHANAAMGPCLLDLCAVTASCASSARLQRLDFPQSGARQTYRNVERALRAAGAGWDDVVKSTTYVTAVRELAALVAVRSEFITSNPPLNTLVQVVKLAIEVEAIAVVCR